MTPKQQRFIEEYLVDLNATQAAIRAGYSARTANEQAARLLAKASVSAAIKQAMDRRSVRTEITQDRVLKEYARLAFSDMRDLMAWGVDGVKLKEHADLTDDQAAAVAEISETKDGALKMKVHDKKGALDSLARHLGMFTDKTELTGKGGGPLEIAWLTEAEAKARGLG